MAILKQVSEVCDGVHYLTCSEIIDLVKDNRLKGNRLTRIIPTLVETLSSATLGRVLAQNMRDEHPRYVVLRRRNRDNTWTWSVLGNRLAQNYRRAHPLQVTEPGTSQALQGMGGDTPKPGRGRGKSVPSPVKFERNRFTNILAGVDGLDD
jgi:hypothetical protein